MTMAPFWQHEENRGADLELPWTLSSIQCLAPQLLHGTSQGPSRWWKETVPTSWGGNGCRAIGSCSRFWRARCANCVLLIGNCWSNGCCRFRRARCANSLLVGWAATRLCWRSRSRHVRCANCLMATISRSFNYPARCHMLRTILSTHNYSYNGARQ